MSTHYRLPDEFETARYHLRRVEVDDAEAIFDSYATDIEVTRFLGWKPHRSLADTSAFLEIAAAEWDVGSGFPVVAFDRMSGGFIGMFHPKLIGHRVNYGYALQRSMWGRGCATEGIRPVTLRSEDRDRRMALFFTLSSDDFSYGQCCERGRKRKD